MRRNRAFSSRRGFLKTAAGIAAASSLPDWFIRECAAQQPATSAKPGSGELRIGLIGCGGQGMGDAGSAARFGKVVALCDVDAAHLSDAKKRFAGAEGYSDFRKLLERKDIDAIICGTVDHWHALVSMAAMKAGKDVYCEKPLTLTIDEGKRLVEVEQQTKRILQTGTQQRSDARFRLACDLVRNARVGKLERVEVWLPAGLRQGPFKTSPVPQGFDYDFWLGQTPKVDYVKERTHFSFRYWWEYSGGTMTDWGAHHNDIVIWALDQERSGPVSVEGKQLVDMIPGGFTAASEYEVSYTWPNGVIHSCRSTTASEWHGGVKDPKRQQHGIKFIGADGWIWVTRGQLEASNPAILNDKLPDNTRRAYVSNDHMGNFMECVKTRKAPICPAEVGYRSASVCQLGVIAIRLGRRLQWDPVKAQFANDAEANKHVAREMRKGYDYGMI
ncbi:MAG TPA: Gfo/Idh/MocA family oxidoreductase [Phycisphaerae bacterium]|nr:Gfo/Idh/MocA family oxidoreductase [Phycisphaerae bacterium]HRY71290.1 Gfo/Idh/MocA family oxidoreductase [Phycisphaerae bacterium]HSA29762.1 Gfo/Idh/MocA family oxidoreductase [Phycisphaerae bacterium]